MSNTERAQYRVLDPAGFYGDDDNLYQEGEEIVFDGTPNEQMEPLNEVAKERLVAYLNTLDDLARLKAERQGVPYVGRPRTLDGAIALLTAEAKSDMNIMGNRNKVSTIERVAPQEAPETGKRGRGRPKGSTKVRLAA